MAFWIFLVVAAVAIGAFFYFVPMLSPKNRFIDAAGNPDLARLKELLAAGGDPNQVGMASITPLTCAVRNRRKENVLFLLENGADPNGKRGKPSPLICAVDEDDLEIAEILLKAGADPHQPGMFGRSAFVDAAVEGRPACLELMHRYGASLDEKWPDDDGLFFQVLSDAVNEKKPEMAAKLYEVVKFFLEHGANPNARMKDDTPAIGLAMQKPEVLRLFIEHGAITDVVWKGVELKEVINQLLSAQQEH